MRRSFGLSLPVIVLASALLGALFAHADPDINYSPAMLTADGLMTPRTRAVISGEFAYLLGTPETILADALIDKFTVSPTGDAVLIAAYKRRPFRGIALSPAQAEPTISELNLIYWDARTRTAKTLLREAIRDDARVTIRQITWLPQTRMAFAVLNRTTLSDGKPTASADSLLRLDTVAGTASRAADLNTQLGLKWRMGGSAPAFEVSPSQPLAYFMGDEDTGAKSGPLWRSSLHIYSQRGLHPPIALPDGVMDLTWMSDGKSLYSDNIVVKTPEGKIARQKILTLVNLETGAVTQPDRLPLIPKSEAARKPLSLRESWAVRVSSANGTLQSPNGRPQAASGLWLTPAASTPKENKSPEGPVSTDSLLIAANARLETELATENAAAILFTRDGSLSAAPVFRLPAQAFEDALRGIQRTATMSNAKQVGLAMMMYTQDYDQNLPLPGDGVRDATGPYLKNPSVFNNPGTGENGFVYSYQGSTNFGQIGQPASTQLGYVTGPGGRAIIWADGHITWVDTP